MIICISHNKNYNEHGLLVVADVNLKILKIEKFDLILNVMVKYKWKIYFDEISGVLFFLYFHILIDIVLVHIFVN